ncbi:DUF6973 domain-containing protein [Ekhidna sp.]
MKKTQVFKSLTIVLLISFAVACNQDSEIVQVDFEESESSLKPKEPEIQFSIDIPYFPWEVLHVLQREYYHKGNKNVKEVEYLENRLIQLYPEKAYKGMYTSFQDELAAYKEEYAQYQIQLCKYQEKMGINSHIEEYPPASFESVEQFRSIVELSDHEFEKLKSLEELATAETLMERKALPSIKQRVESSVVFAGLSGIGTALGYAGHFAGLSQDRANQKAEEFYRNWNQGERGDAFRHVFVSMHLRRYLTKLGAKLIMEEYERQNPNLYPGDTEMDLHNNIVGRDTQYNTFRGSYFSSWETWASNVRNYINGIPENGLPMDQLENWNGSTTPSSKAIAESDITAQFQSAYRYVYYEKTRSVSLCYGVNCIQGYNCNNITGQCEYDPGYNNCVNCGPTEECINNICRPF